MIPTQDYSPTEPRRSEVDAMTDPLVLEFGTAWCGYCRAAQALIADAFQSQSPVHHLKVEDGSGRPLGRSFRVKLWPTLIFMKEGKEVARLVRPANADEIRQALSQITS
jgi:thioredoxin 1